MSIFDIKQSTTSVIKSNFHFTLKWLHASKHKQQTNGRRKVYWLKISKKNAYTPNIIVPWMSMSSVIYYYHAVLSGPSIVNRGEWLRSLANLKGGNKDGTIYVGRSMTVHNLFFCTHIVCMNYIPETSLLVSSSIRSKQLLCFLCTAKAKKSNKHVQQRTFSGSMTIPLY